MSKPIGAPERRRGILIVFEGPEGAGKSTQIARLARRLEGQGTVPLCTREPGGTPAGDAIRGVLLDGALRIDAMSEFLLYSASRAQHVAEVIGPALERGEIVVSDRFTAASVAYQGYGRGLDLDFVTTLNTRVTGGIEPTLTVLLDIDPEAGLARASERGVHDRMEQASISFHRRVRAGFLEQASGRTDWLVIDASLEADAVDDQIWTAVRRTLQGLGWP